MDCSLVDEQVLMRSMSLLWVEWRWWERDPWLPFPKESPPPALSLGKEKELDQLAGDGDAIAQKVLLLWAGLEGTNASFSPPPGDCGEIRGATVMTRGLFKGIFRGATAICGIPAVWGFWVSSQLPTACLTLASMLPDALLLLLLLLPWGLSSILIFDMSVPNHSPFVAVSG